MIAKKRNKGQKRSLIRTGEEIYKGEIVKKRRRK